MNPFFEEESNQAEAVRKAKAKERFWRMVFAGGGLTYPDLCGMDLAEFYEAEAARLLWQTEWK